MSIKPNSVRIDVPHRDVPWITTKDKTEIPYESVFYRTPE